MFDPPSGRDIVIHMWWLVRIWVPIATAVSILSIALYVSVQQNYRASLNDPQIQMAEDGAAILAAGGVPDDVVPRVPRRLDVASSLAPWIAVYDASSTPLEASAVLNAAPPAVPLSMLERARGSTSSDAARPLSIRAMWEPQEGVRQALVVAWEPKSQRYVVAGRNASEVEYRIWQLQLIIGLGWFMTLVITLFAAWLSTRVSMFREE